MLLRSELAQSASQNDLNRPWHYQITIHDRGQASHKLGEAERRARFRLGESRRVPGKARRHKEKPKP